MADDLLDDVRITQEQMKVVDEMLEKAERHRQEFVVPWSGLDDPGPFICLLYKTRNEGESYEERWQRAERAGRAYLGGG